MDIHKTAIINPGADLDDEVSIGPYAIINEKVRIGSGTRIGPYCVIESFTTIGKNCQIFSGAIIGSITQDKKFKGARSFLEIGDNNIIREYATINRGTEEDSRTIIGNDNLIMAYSHIAHDCRIGNEVVIANCGTLAGYVTIEDKVILGGLSAVHQYVRMGELAIIGGCSKVVQDIVPYSMADGHPTEVYGINSLGLERADIQDEIRNNLKKAFKMLFSMKLNVKNALARIEKEIPPSREINHLIDFIRTSQRGISR